MLQLFVRYQDKPYTWWSILRFMPSVFIEPVTGCHNWSRSITYFYVSTQLVSFLDSTQLVAVLQLGIIIFSLEAWLNWVRFLIPCCFQLFIHLFNSLCLPFGSWWKTLPTIFHRIWLVRPIPQVKYTRILYPYIPRSFNYSDLYDT